MARSPLDLLFQVLLKHFSVKGHKVAMEKGGDEFNEKELKFLVSNH